MAILTSGGVVVEVSTDDGPLAGWLRTGRGEYGPTGERIEPTNDQSLAFQWQGQEMVLAFAGMKPSAWQQTATREAVGLSVTQGQAIGVRVRDRLAGQG